MFPPSWNFLLPCVSVFPPLVDLGVAFEEVIEHLLGRILAGSSGTLGKVHSALLNQAPQQAWRETAHVTAAELIHQEAASVIDDDLPFMIKLVGRTGHRIDTRSKPVFERARQLSVQRRQIEVNSDFEVRQCHMIVPLRPEPVVASQEMQRSNFQ